MAIELIKFSRNTRGLNSRLIEYFGVGKIVTKTVAKESKPVYNEDGSPKLDEKGNQVREALGKDAAGKLITIDEQVEETITKGVLTDLADAMELVANAPHETVPAYNEDGSPKVDEKGEAIFVPISDEQILLDCFVEGFNERQYAIEANKDELDEFIADMEMNDDQKAAFKKTARQISRNYDLSLVEAAEHVKLLMQKAKAKQAAKAETVPA
jgi:hypothetical protein